MFCFISYVPGTAPIVPFLPVYAKQLGFSSVLVGLIYSVLPLMGMLAKPLMGAIADKFHCHKGLFVSFIIVSIVSFFSMMYIPPIGTRELKLDIQCDSLSEVKICNSGNDKCLLDRVSSEEKESSIQCQVWFYSVIFLFCYNNLISLTGDSFWLS